MSNTIQLHNNEWKIIRYLESLSVHDTTKKTIEKSSSYSADGFQTDFTPLTVFLMFYSCFPVLLVFKGTLVQSK